MTNGRSIRPVEQGYVADLLASAAVADNFEDFRHR